MLFTPNTLDTGYNEFMNEHQNNKQQCSVSSGGSRTFQTGGGWGWGKNLLFGKPFPENRMKMKEIELEGARDAPPGPANSVTLQ